MQTSRWRSRARAGRPLFPAIAAAWLGAACAGPVAPDLILTNARVFTNDRAQPWAEAVAIKGQRVVAVGAAATLGATAAPGTRVIDAGGRLLVPGFNDARVDLPLEPPTPGALAALDRQAIARGVTSLQVVAGGPMRTLVVAAQQAQRAARWRVIRSPMDGERPQDEEPFLPPQPGERLFAQGVSWTLGPGDGRARLDPGRLATVLGWAYGAEDPIVLLAGGSEPLSALTAAFSQVGLPAVWQRKRPRLDVRRGLVPEAVAALRALGVVVTWLPAVRGEAPAGAAPAPPTETAGSAAAAGLTLAAGSGGLPQPMPVLAALTAAGPGMVGPALTREAAVRAMTWGSAYAEKAERDKGWLGPGTLADLAVLADDIVAAPVDRLGSATSVLTVVGGTIVYDPGVLTK